MINKKEREVMRDVYTLYLLNFGRTYEDTFSNESDAISKAKEIGFDTVIYKNDQYLKIVRTLNI